MILLFNGAQGVHIGLLSVVCTFQNADKLEHLCAELKLEKLVKILEKCYLINISCVQCVFILDPIRVQSTKPPLILRIVQYLPFCL